MSNSIFNTIKPLTSLGIDSLTGLPGDATIYTLVSLFIRAGSKGYEKV